jgi:hypothetical protein
MSDSEITTPGPPLHDLAGTAGAHVGQHRADKGGGTEDAHVEHRGFDGAGIGDVERQPFDLVRMRGDQIIHAVVVAQKFAALRWH